MVDPVMFIRRMSLLIGIANRLWSEKINAN